MKCILIDDEPLARQGLSILLEKMDNINIVASIGSPFEALPLLKKEKIDLIFLDINMPDLNGIDFVKTLENPPMIIFITAYSQYALDSYEINAIDYLVKPVRVERLIKAINKAKNYCELLSNETENSKIESFVEDYVYIKADRKYTKVFFKNILYIEGLKDYVIIKQKDKKLLAAMNLKTIASHLPSNLFARVNKSYIVNVENIESIDSYSIVIDGEEIPLGEMYKQIFISNYVIDKTLGGIKNK